MTASSSTRPEPAWWAEARDLRAQGMTYRAIGLALGVSAPAANYAVNPARRERANAYGKAWGLRNPGYYSEASREWAKSNPERIREHKAKYRADRRERRLASSA